MSSVRIDDTTLRKIAAQFARPLHAKVGILQGSGAASKGLTMVELGAIHEFGSPAAMIPERSWLRSTFRDRSRLKQLEVLSGRLASLVVTMRIDMRRATDVIGQWGAAEVKKNITLGPGIPPPNAPSTIARKGSSRTLVDTGRFVGSITSQVVEGEP